MIFFEEHSETELKVIFAVLDDGIMEIGQRVLDGMVRRDSEH